MKHRKHWQTSSVKNSSSLLMLMRSSLISKTLPPSILNNKKSSQKSWERYWSWLASTCTMICEILNLCRLLLVYWITSTLTKSLTMTIWLCSNTVWLNLTKRRRRLIQDADRLSRRSIDRSVMLNWLKWIKTLKLKKRKIRNDWVVKQILMHWMPYSIRLQNKIIKSKKIWNLEVSKLE